MEWYQRGNWVVGTPIWQDPNGFTNDQVIEKMICVHPSWTAEEEGVMMDPDSQEPKPAADPNTGETIWSVTEICALCEANRFRWIPEKLKDEPFDYSTPASGPWYERLYNLGNFVLLARRYQNNPNVPPSFMTRVETQAGSVHTGIVQLETLLFSPSALAEIADMERMIKLGPQRYASYRILKEGRKTKEEKDDIKDQAKALGQVVQDIGPESIAAARAIFEAEIDHEIQEMEEYQIQQMEREVAERKAQMEERKKKGKQSK